MDFEEKVQRSKELDEKANNWPIDKQKRIANLIVDAIERGIGHLNDLTEEEKQDVLEQAEAMRLQVEITY